MKAPAILLAALAAGLLPALPLAAGETPAAAPMTEAEREAASRRLREERLREARAICDARGEVARSHPDYAAMRSGRSDEDFARYVADLCWTSFRRTGQMPRP